jgi:hypothetical protein
MILLSPAVAMFYLFTGRGGESKLGKWLIMPATIESIVKGDLSASMSLSIQSSACPGTEIGVL